jgi:NMD protein affecting ribosome stability and mRNA decay
MCTDCFNTVDSEFVCDICRCKFTDTHKTYNDFNSAICKMCRSSNQIKQRYLHNYQNNESINKMLDISDKKIKIYYNVIDETHYGLCSEVETIEKNMYSEEKIFPFMNEFNTNENLINSDKFNYYYTPLNTSNCGLGCTQKRYEIINYEIIL